LLYSVSRERLSKHHELGGLGGTYHYYFDGQSLIKGCRVVVSPTIPPGVSELLGRGPVGGRGFFLVLVAITYRSVQNRRLPWYYGMYGLLFITGSVYVVTLEKRSEDAPAFQDAVSRRLARHPILLGLLTFVMSIYLIVGSSILLAMLLVPFGLAKVYVNGQEAESLLEVLPGLPVVPYFIGLGAFHFAVTRKRVKALIRPLNMVRRRQSP